MRYDFTPFYRSTVGFDRLLNLLDQSSVHEGGPNWPPYDIEKIGEDHYRISMALAGFSPEEIELVQHENTLNVSGAKQEVDGGQFLHRGIAGRAFKQSFDLADHVKVLSANLENGLLTIELKHEIPEAMKPRRIDVSTTDKARQVSPKAQVSDQNKAA